MSLLLPNDHRRGNPAWKKGVAQNPAGRPKGKYSGIKKTLHRLKRDPIEELIELADLAKGCKNYAMAVAIWKDIHEENSTFPSLGDVEKEGQDAAKALAALEKGTNSGTNNKFSSITPSLGTGEITLQTPPNPEINLSSSTK